MSRNTSKQFAILAAQAATGTGLAMDVESYMHVLLTISSQTSANFTVKFQVSMSDTCPDFSAAQSATNEWDYLQIKNYQDGSTVNGDTGVAFAGTDDVQIYEANTNGMKWICATVTARSAGSVNVKAKGFSNE